MIKVAPQQDNMYRIAVKWLFRIGYLEKPASLYSHINNMYTTLRRIRSLYILTAMHRIRAMRKRDSLCFTDIRPEGIGL